jgi:uncharacterized protein (TIGR01777 family)
MASRGNRQTRSGPKPNPYKLRPVNVLITGGTGFLGSTLVKALRHRGHHVTVLSRHPRKPGEALWPDDGQEGALLARVDRTDAVINLTGESIAGARWTPARKEAIRASRVNPTRALASAIATASSPPAVFLSGSAVGFYGVRDDTPLDESSSNGTDFLGEVCADWEHAALAASGHTRVVLLRTGIVLDGHGGALPQMARPFRFGVGGPLGSGRQYLSWIHLQDWINLALWSLERDAVSGALNLTAPAPVTNEEFSRLLAGELHRPGFMRAPAFALRLLLGEMADALLLGGQRVLPRKAESQGYSFRYAHLAPALHAIYGG